MSLIEITEQEYNEFCEWRDLGFNLEDVEVWKNCGFELEDLKCIIKLFETEK